MDNGILPPEGGQDFATPVEPTPVMPSGGQMPPMMPVKRKLKAWFVVLGLVTPWAVLLCQGFLLNALASNNFAGSIVAATAGLLNTAVFVVILVAFLVGRGKEDTRLRSFGVGGLISYGITVLIALLAFGTCMLTLGGQ